VAQSVAPSGATTSAEIGGCQELTDVQGYNRQFRQRKPAAGEMLIGS